MYELDILKSYILWSFLGDTPLGFHISLADIISDVDISSFSNSTIDFLKICKKVYDLKPGRYDWDLHFGNFMKRDNVLVITDPYAGDDFKNTKMKIKEIAKIITMYTKTT